MRKNVRRKGKKCYMPKLLKTVKHELPWKSSTVKIQLSERSLNLKHIPWCQATVRQHPGWKRKSWIAEQAERKSESCQYRENSRSKEETDKRSKRKQGCRTERRLEKKGDL